MVVDTALFGQSVVRRRILERFFAQPDVVRHVRELARELGSSATIVGRELDRFERAGILVSERIGTVRRYRVDDRSPITQEVRSLVQTTRSHPGAARASDVVSPHLDAIADLCRRRGVRRLALFGSVTRGEFDPRRSDIDFLVEFKPLPSGAYAVSYFGLLEDLQQLLGRPVDLVVESAIRNPYFRESVERTQTPIYAA